MPVVKTQTSVKAVVELKAVDFITQKEIADYIPVAAKFVELNKQMKAIEKQYEAMKLTLLVKATGLKMEDHIKAKTPSELEAIVSERMNNGTLKMEEGKFDFSIEPSQPNGRVTVPWQAEVFKLKGEDYVKQLQAETKPTFSYKVIPIESK